MTRTRPSAGSGSTSRPTLTPNDPASRHSVPMLGLVRAFSICTSMLLLTPARWLSSSIDQPRAWRSARTWRATAARVAVNELSCTVTILVLCLRSCSPPHPH